MWNLLQAESGLIGVSSKILKIPEGIYSHLCLRWSGTNQAAQTAALADLGTPTLKWNDLVVARASAANLKKITSLSFGVPLISSAAGAAFDMSVIIPFRNDFSKIRDNNVLAFGGVSGDNIEIPGLSAVVFASCNFEIFGLYDFGVARYIPNVAENTISVAASDVENLTERNIGYIMINQPTNVPTDLKIVKVTRGGDVIRCGGGYAAGEIMTNILCEIESSTEDCIIVNFDPSANIVDGIGKSYKLYHVAAAANDLTYVVFQYYSDNLEVSRSRVNNYAAVRVEDAMNTEPNLMAGIVPTTIQGPTIRLPGITVPVSGAR